MDEKQTKKVKQSLKEMALAIINRNKSEKGFPAAASFWEDQSKIMVDVNKKKGDANPKTKDENTIFDCKSEGSGEECTRHIFHVEMQLIEKIERMESEYIFGIISLPPCCWCLTELDRLGKKYDLLIITDSLHGKMEKDPVKFYRPRVQLIEESIFWDEIKSDEELLVSFYFLKLKTICGSLTHRTLEKEDKNRLKNEALELNKEFEVLNIKPDREFYKKILSEWKREKRWWK